MYVREYFCLGRVYNWKLHTIFPVQFLGVRGNSRHYLNLNNLEIVYFWIDENESEDCSSDYFRSWRKYKLVETNEKIVIYWSDFYECFCLNTPFPNETFVGGLERMTRWTI